MLYGTTVTYDNSNCSTGCPTCGCTNPNCRYSTWNTWGSTNNYQFRLDTGPKPAPVPEAWLIEQRRTPRKMKRPFPANKPASHQAYRRACY